MPSNKFRINDFLGYIFIPSGVKFINAKRGKTSTATENKSR